MKREVVYGPVTEAMLKDDNIIVFGISKEEVNSKNFDRIFDTLTCASRLGGVGKDAHGKLMLAFAYDDDPRELYEIPEVCEYMRNVYKTFPFFFYFLTPYSAANIALLYCIIGVSVVSKSRSTGNVKVALVSEAEATELIKSLTQATRLLGISLGDTEGVNAALQSMGLA